MFIYKHPTTLPPHTHARMECFVVAVLLNNVDIGEQTALEVDGKIVILNDA